MAIAMDYLYQGTDTSKINYLGYRYCGLTQEEAARFTGIHITRVPVWHEDDSGLRELESRISRSGFLRTTLRWEVLELSPNPPKDDFGDSP